MSIGRLNGLIGQAEEYFSSRDYKKFWESVKEINGILQNLHLATQNRQEIQDWLNDRCSKAKSNMAAQTEERKNSSFGKRKLVEITIRQAIAVTHSASTSQDLARANELLKKASERMKDGYNNGFGTSYMLTVHDGVLTREDRDWCSDLWHEAKDGIEDRRQQINDDNYRYFSGQAAQAFNEAHAGNGRRAKDIIKETQEEMQSTSMTADQFSIVRRNIATAWQLADSIQHQKREDWKKNQRDYIRRLEELVDKNEDVIARIEGQISHCEDLKAGARSDDYAEMVQGWINEKNTKIDDIESTNRELRDKIREAKRQLND